MRHDEKSIAGRTVLVTGGTGFVGSRLVRRLTAEGARVIVSLLSTDTVGSTTSLQGVARIVPLDVRDEEAVSDCMMEYRPEIVFHLAALVSSDRDPTLLPRMFDINHRGTVHLLSAAEKLGNVRVVHMGSCEEYGDGPVPFREGQREQPVSPYGLSKLAATNACLYYHRRALLSAVVLRPTVIYGPGETRASLLSSVVEAYMQGQTPCMSPGEQTRDFVYVDDVVEACLRSGVCAGAGGKIINVGTGTEITVAEAARKVQERSQRSEPPDTGISPYRENEIMRYVASTERAREILGWKAAVTIEEGIDRLWTRWGDVWPARDAPGTDEERSR